MHEDVAKRFWSKVDKRGPDECWPWTAGTAGKGGYGRFRMGDKRVQASRVAWEMEHGRPLPPELDALHSCDNPPCVNPAHIWPGTAADNVRDAVAKGRAPQFEKNALCQRGHLIETSAQGGRRCRVCMHAAQRRWYEAKVRA
jgi:HNH endonuclease